MTGSSATSRAAASDLLSLTKPRVTVMAAFASLAGVAVARGPVGGGRALAIVLGTALAAGAASALNMYLEGDRDALMKRTAGRPLPAGRVRPGTALGLGLALGLAGVGSLAALAGTIPAVLAGVSIASYVLVYTPLKYRTPHAVFVGALPGAAPVIIGASAAGNGLDPAGLALFAVLVLWQLAHSLAIAIYAQRDYASAGVRCAPLVWGTSRARAWCRVFSWLLLPASLSLVALGRPGWLYGGVAIAAGTWFTAAAGFGEPRAGDLVWARRLFRASLVYLLVLGLGLVIDWEALPR